ncbi:Stk1 family PASTA domain-containing Ser/Thr kinase [Lentzea tibetensis]|uniref:non-specific serine/threonine protein kinase n=2 Tax=Lentzea tibetensis TaxID=2591470 RepID=A0A563EFF6_9PSEU|nr:Stk1 family PASTA domain-containing Ser/Thr kinase [Lentzea tibetensis]
MGGLLDQRYRVDTVLARGGMSTVYRGRDTRLDRAIAVKVMDPTLSSDPSFVARFEREARAAAQLHHPAVVAVHDQGVDGDQVYLVMELVEGGNLRDLLNQRGSLDPAIALSVLGPVLSALGAAHRAGLVHRDVKPENVLIGQGGQIKVADFGLVRAVADAGATSDSTILGTVAYLSPEQVEHGVSDARSDVYSAGILLYELLTGEAPYRGDTPISVAFQHVNSDVPSIPGIPLALDNLVRKSTRRDAALRPPDAFAFLEELERVGTEIGLTPQPVPVPGTPPEEDRTVIMRPVAVAVGSTPPSAAEATTPVPKPASATSVMSRPQPPRKPKPKPRPKKVDPVEEERLRSKRRFIIWTSVVAVLALIVGLFSWWLGSGRWTAVPEVGGQTETNAVALVRNASLTALVVKEPSDEVPNGTVLRTEPGNGTELRKGQSVKVIVSRGKPVVPFVNAGVDEQAAIKEIEQSGLKAVKDDAKNAFSDTVPTGKVVGLDPRPGTQLTVGGSVTLIISKGPQPRKPVPNVTGKTKDEAFAELQRAGLEAVELRTEASDVVEKDRVVRTEPAAGTVLTGGERRVGLVISSGSDNVEVPNVTGRKMRDAERELEQRGFKVNKQFNERGTCFNQSIPPGQRVPRGTEITIFGV